MMRAGTTLIGTAAERIGLAPVRAGQLFVETDTGAVYMADETPAWQYYPNLIPGPLAVDGILTTTEGRIQSVTRVAAGPYNVLATDEVIFVDTDGGVIVVNLPAGVVGTHYKIVNVGSSVNNATITPNGVEQIFGGGAGVPFALVDGAAINIHFETTEGWW